MVCPPNRVDSSEVYNPTVGTWAPTGDLVEARYQHSATVLPGGRVVVAGGVALTNGDLDASYTAEIYDPATGQWHLTASLREGRYAHTAVMLSDGRIMIVGGILGGWWLRNSAEVYDPETERWTMLAAMDVGRSGHTGTALTDGRVLVTGGMGLSSWAPYEVQTTAELFSPIGPPPRAFLPSVTQAVPAAAP